MSGAQAKNLFQETTGLGTMIEDIPHHADYR